MCWLIPDPALQDTQLDLVGLLSQQLSRSGVQDWCPPLALTPRGGGAGYGVGLDLESLVAAASDNGQQDGYDCTHAFTFSLSKLKSFKYSVQLSPLIRNPLIKNFRF